MSEDKNNTLLGIRDIVIMNVIAILSLRQIPQRSALRGLRNAAVAARCSLPIPAACDGLR